MFDRMERWMDEYNQEWICLGVIKDSEGTECVIMEPDKYTKLWTETGVFDKNYIMTEWEKVRA